MNELIAVLEAKDTLDAELVVGKEYYKGNDGVPGKDGKDGSDQVYIGADEPTDERVKLWIDTDATPSSGAEPDAYIKDASVSGNTLTLTKKDDTNVVFTPSGGSSGGGSYTLPVASFDKLGGIKVGIGQFATNGCVVLELDEENLAYTPCATSTAAGSVLPFVGKGLNYNYDTGALFMNVATSKVTGTVKPDGKTITVDTNGVIKAINTYTLPTASASTLGGVKVDNDTIKINNGVISIDKSQLSASNGLPTGGTWNQVLIKNSSTGFDAYWGDIQQVLNIAGISTGGSDWQYTHDSYDSNLYNAKELVVCIENINGNTQMGYFNFGDSNLGNHTNEYFYFDYDTSSPYISYDGTRLGCLAINNINYICYKT